MTADAKPKSFQALISRLNQYRENQGRQNPQPHTKQV